MTMTDFERICHFLESKSMLDVFAKSLDNQVLVLKLTPLYTIQIPPKTHLSVPPNSWKIMSFICFLSAILLNTFIKFVLKLHLLNIK